MSVNFEELERIKVLVVDDHTFFAEGTVSLLSFEPRILPLGVAKNEIECMDLISKTVPEVVLLDLNLPDICGTDLLDKIKRAQPEVKIIMLTGQNPQGYITESISKGVQGFLPKDCSVKEMIEAILRVYEGGVYFSQSLEAFMQPVKNSNKLHFTVNSQTAQNILLAPREIIIMEFVSKGLHNKEIALALGFNIRTVEFHVSNILAKLGVSNRFEAVLKWAYVDKETGHSFLQM